MKFKRAICLFEQSGTFKHQFELLGYPAFDYDLLNEFGCTDFVVDLFQQINEKYNNSYEYNIFDDFTEDDIILAFFPCTRFETQISMAFRGESYQMRDWKPVRKLDYAMKLHNELHEYYMILCKLCTICYKNNLRLIVENPFTQPHYLNSYFPLKPSIIDYDRRVNGDYYKKPTQYFFINCEPEYSFTLEIMDGIKNNITKCSNIDNKSRKTSRSMISPVYAKRFIEKYIIGENIFKGDI